MFKNPEKVFLTVYAAEFGPDGKSISTETVDRCLAAVTLWRQHPQGSILLAAGGDRSYNESQNNAELMKSYLINQGIPRGQIFICGQAVNTVGECHEMDRFIKQESGSGNFLLYAISSWYHLPRITAIWLFRHGRLVRPKAAWIFSSYVLKRTILEPFKIILVFLCINPMLRAKISRWFGQRGWI